MTSKDADVSEHALINLIYQHLKENGHEKVANVLKKHAPQVEATSGNVSLKDIFMKWLNNKGETKSGGDILAAKVSKPKATRRAAHSSKSTQNGQSQRSTGEKDISPNLAEAPAEAIPGHTSRRLTAGGDSDSDSSLDEEKWKSLALVLSDAEIGKMDIFTNFCMTAAASRVKSTTRRKPAQTKEDSNQNTTARKTKAKTVTSLLKTDKTSTPLKPSVKKNTRASEKTKNKNPSNKLKDTGNLDFTKVETPEAKFAEETVTPRDKANGHSKTDNIKTSTRNVKSEKTQSVSESGKIATPTQTAKSQKSDELVEPEEVHTPRKNAKSKKVIKLSEPLKSPTVSDTNCDISYSKLADTPSKKGKSKKSAKHPEPLNEDIPSGVDNGIACIHIPSKKAKSTDLLEDLLNLKSPETPSKKSKKVKSPTFTEPVDLKTLSKKPETEIVQLETPSKKTKAKKVRTHQDSVDANTPSLDQTEDVSRHLTSDQLVSPTKNTKTKSVVESDPVERHCKKAKAKKTDTSSEQTAVQDQEMQDHTKGVHSNSPSKKAKHDAGNSFSESILETPSRKSKVKKGKELDHVQSPVDAGEEVSDIDTAADQYNCKPSDCPGKDETTSVSSKSKSSLKGGLVSTKHKIGLEEHESPQTQIQDVKKKRKNKDEENINISELEEAPTEPKKKKKEKKKDTDGSVVEIPPEQSADNLASSPSKKKKKGKTYGDEETALMCVPSHEEEPPNKKKKSSKRTIEAT